MIGASDPATPDDSPEANLDKSMRLLAKLPSIVAYDQRRRHELEFVEPRADLGFSANFLWQTFGEAAELPVVTAFDVSMILYAEHSFNASTFTARVITSTLADLYSAVVGAIGALKGPLHGGANEAVMHAFDEIGAGEGGAERAVAWLDTALAEKRKIMGFGHRVYKNGDSRVPTMRDSMERMVEHYDRPDLLELYVALEQAMGERKGIKPNLDYPAGPTYHMMGFDTLTFTPLFVASRITGWTAHIMEQAASNALIRPLSVYNGHARTARAREGLTPCRTCSSRCRRRSTGSRPAHGVSLEHPLGIDGECVHEWLRNSVFDGASRTRWPAGRRRSSV